jgi:hypothetical protein
MDEQINQWGTLTGYTVEHLPDTLIECPDPSGPYGSFIEVGRFSSIGTVEFTGVAPATPEVLEAINRWAKNGKGRLPNWKEEWMCLYCGTPQSLLNRKCDDCGAPRNWLIG